MTHSIPLQFIWEPEMAIYLLLALVLCLVIYLFYAVIHPEQF